MLPGIPPERQRWTHATHRVRRNGWKAKPGLKLSDNFGGSTDRSCGSADKMTCFFVSW